MTKMSSNIFRLDGLEDEDIGLRESSSSSNKPKLLSLGRLFNILFDAEPRELEKVIVQNRQRLEQKSSVSRALLALVGHVKSTSCSGSSVEHIFVPILQHVVKSREHSNRKRSVCILRWLLQSEEVGVIVASNLATIVGTQQSNNRLMLGWCVVVRDVVQSLPEQVSTFRRHQNEIFSVLIACIPHLTRIVCVASAVDDRKRVPTRLTIVAADCMLTMTKAIAAGNITEGNGIQKEDLDTGQSTNSLITPLDTKSDDDKADCRSSARSIKGGSEPSTSSYNLLTSSERRNMALWELLDDLLALVNTLHEWNNRSRPLFAKGLERVQKQLLSLAYYRDSVQSWRAEEGEISIGAEVLAACWHHYGGLLMTEDKTLSTNPNSILQHWLGALKYYVQEREESDTEAEMKRTQEMQGHALACLALVLGRLDARRLELVLEELEPQLLNVLFSQLRGGDTIIVELAVGILRAILFRPFPLASGAVTVSPTSRFETVIPLLMEMLDTRDMAARAVVLLVAEYFAANPEAVEYEKLFSRLDSEDSLQRRNALDVLTELVSICSRQEEMINSILSQTIARHLFRRLGDTELTNRAEASALFASLDPSFTLPTLLELLQSPDGRVRSAASAGILSIMKAKANQCQVIAELLDCVSKAVKAPIPIPVSQTDGASSVNTTTDAAQLDVDRLMRLIPEWASEVDDWHSIIHLILKKMFDEPANAVIPRFLSCISKQLAENTQVVFPILLEKLRLQSQLTENFISGICVDSGATATLLFERLSPLLALRVLPLEAFDDITCKDLYGGLTAIAGGKRDLETDVADSITSHLMNRACGSFEFEDVRKVSSEITGRLIPDVLLPLITPQLEDATRSQDLLRVKSCLYAVCTSLVIRGKASLDHYMMGRIRKILSSILLWPCLVDEKGFSEVAKAQHGCIDCLAFMICAETQTQKPSFTEEEPDEVLSARGQTEVRKELSKGENPSRNTLVSRPPLEIVEERAGAEELAEALETEPTALRGGIQLIEKLPESEQLQMTSSARKDVGSLSMESTAREKLNKELSGKGEKVSHRLSDLKQESGEISSGEQQRSSQSLLIEELPAVRSSEKPSREGALRGSEGRLQPKVLIQELSDLEWKWQKAKKDNKLNDRPQTVLLDIVDCLTGNKKGLPWSCLSDETREGSPKRQVNGFGDLAGGSMFVSTGFRICMANILISVCQKISLGARAVIAAKVIPPLVTFIQMSNDSKLRGACLQVLFTAVYHLKAPSVLPYASDLMVLSLAAIKGRGLLEERVGGAKLLASLLASDDALVAELAPHLIDAQVALSSISALDSSPELRALCERLLSCLSLPGTRKGDV